MTLRVGEVGKKIYVGVDFNVNTAPFTEVTLYFSPPEDSDAVAFNRNSSSGVTAPTTDSPDLGGDIGVLPANTYLVYVTQAGDFTHSGFWTVCAKYEDNAPSVLYGDETRLTVDKACG